MKRYLGNLQLGQYSYGLWSGRPVFDSRQVQDIILYFTQSRPVLGPTEPPIQWVSCTPSVDVKQPGRETDFSPPAGERSRMMALRRGAHVFGFRKECCLFKTMLLLTRRPLRTGNWQIFTLKFWNTRPDYSPDLAPSDYYFFPNLSIKPKTYQPPSYNSTPTYVFMGYVLN
jgi:hypothetical protein